MSKKKRKKKKNLVPDRFRHWQEKFGHHLLQQSFLYSGQPCCAGPLELGIPTICWCTTVSWWLSVLCASWAISQFALLLLLFVLE